MRHERPRATRALLYGAARPKPPTLRRRAPKNTKNPSGGWGRTFWTESGSLMSVSKSILPPTPVWRVPTIGKKRRFDTFFGRVFAFSKVTKCGKLQHFCLLTFFCCSHAKTQKMLQIPILFGPEMHKTLQIPVFLKAKQKTHCKLQHFWRVDRKKCWYSHNFCNFKKTWKARNIVNSGVLATF